MSLTACFSLRVPSKINEAMTFIVTRLICEQVNLYEAVCGSGPTGETRPLPF